MKGIFYNLFFTLLLITAGSARAVTHTINFGVGGSLTYSPSSLAVNVGDVITWSGDFGFHPLQSTSVPAGAASFGPITTGTSFSYTVTVVGTYRYQCNVHFRSGMTGSFSAAASGVEIPQNNKMIMDPIYPNPAMDEAMVHFTLDNPAHVTLRIYNAMGALVQTPTNEDMSAGFHMLMIDTKQLASGSYQYVLQAGDAVLRRAMIVAK